MSKFRWYLPVSVFCSVSCLLNTTLMLLLLRCPSYCSWGRTLAQREMSMKSSSHRLRSRATSTRSTVSNTHTHFILYVDEST